MFYVVLPGFSVFLRVFVFFRVFSACLVFLLLKDRAATEVYTLSLRAALPIYKNMKKRFYDVFTRFVTKKNHIFEKISL